MFSIPSESQEDGVDDELPGLHVDEASHGPGIAEASRCCGIRPNDVPKRSGSDNSVWASWGDCLGGRISTRGLGVALTPSAY
jgi:hypothetical protein